MNVVIRDSASADLDQIYEWIGKDRPAAAISVIERIFDSLDRLAIFPFMGHRGLVPGTFEWNVPGLPFILVYEIDETAQELRVIAVLHASQDRE